jgi:hypothetical protein
MHTPIQFPAVLFEEKASVDNVVVPASLPACCTKLIPPPLPPEVTVKATLLLATPLTVTTTFPVVAPVGTDVAMLVALQLVAVAAVPLNVTVLVPCVDPKPVPVIVTPVPTGPEVCDRLVIVGAEAAVTVKLTLLLATPFTVTTTFPVVAPVGTDVTMLVALQLVVVAVVPLNVTVLVPCVDPKFVPVIVTAVPTGPEVGDRLVILGVVPPPLAAALNAARPAAQLSAPPSVALADAAPAVAWI